MLGTLRPVISRNTWGRASQMVSPIRRATLLTLQRRVASRLPACLACQAPTMVAIGTRLFRIFSQRMRYERIRMPVTHAVLSLEPVHDLHVLQALLRADQRFPLSDRLAVCLLDRREVRSRAFDLLVRHESPSRSARYTFSAVTGRWRTRAP